MTGKKQSDWSGRILVLAVCAAAFMLIVWPQRAAQGSRAGLELCGRTVIPSLFPFMVLSGLLMRSGVCSAVGRVLERPMRAVFGVGGGGAAAIFLGALCGFPVGALACVGLYDRGEADGDEAARILAVCNYPSLAFLVSTLGVSLLGSRSAGGCIAFSVWGAGLLCGAVGKFFFSRGSASRSAKKRPCKIGLRAKDLTDAVAQAASATVVVCAYVVFFSCLTGCMELSLQGAPAAGVRAFFELTSGVCAAAALPDGRVKMILCAAAAGWSGVSVHLQVAAAAEGKISLRPYLISKAAQAAVAAALCAALVACFPSLAPVGVGAEQTGGLPAVIGWSELLPQVWIALSDCAFAGALALCAIRGKRGLTRGEKRYII